MNYDAYTKLTPVCLPSVDTVNSIRQKYYPGMPAIEAVKDAPASQTAGCEPGKPSVTKDQLDGFIYDASEGDPNDPNDGQMIEAGKAQQHDLGALVKYVTGTGENGKYQRLIYDVSVATKNTADSFMTKATDWVQDRIADVKPVIEAVVTKVKAMWTKFTDWLKSIFE